MRALALLPLALLLACPGGDVGVVKTRTDNDSDGYTAEVDCNDARADVNPEAEERCDGVDNDCDGTVDQGATDALAFFADADADGHGDVNAPHSACEQPAGAVPSSDDCDDGEAAAFPGNPEVCDGVDNDCNGSVDDDPSDLATFYADTDGDGHGDGALAVDACEAPADYVADATDCDDANAAVHPEAAETDCTDPVDYNCDGSVMYADADHDGAPACEDCDDTTAARSPLNDELCDEADLDEDCDGLSDDDDDSTTAASMPTWYRDADGDGYSTGTGVNLVQCEAPTAYASATGDCDDYDPVVNPGATEVCDAYDVDEDCDGASDDDDATTDPATYITYYRDADHDTYGDASRSASQCEAPSNYVANSTDCDDTDADRNPGESEVCDAADKDEDCDGLADEADSSVSGTTAYYADSDGDSHGDAGAVTYACSAPANHVTDATDCDDGSAAVHPGATEVCDAANTDEDCDLLADDDDSGVASSGKSTWYRDADSDTFGAAASSLSRCDQPSGYVANDDDCLDTDADTFPGSAASESASACMTDEDGDGYGDSAPASGVTAGTDCDDSTSVRRPGATELCSTTYDDDCDGSTNDPGASGCSTYYYDADGDGYGLLTASQCTCTASGDYDVTGVTSANDDCDDTKAAVNPAGSEVCDAANADEDCDGLADDADSSVASGGKVTVYADADGDTYGSATAGATYCDAPAGYASNTTDCDDTRSGVNPAATETCATTYDDDCDTDTNEVGATGCTTWYYDGDNDGYAVLTASQCTCSATGSYDVSGVTSADDDCDDTSTSVSPGAAEVCSNGVDEDCDGTADDGCSTYAYAGDYEAEYASTGTTDADAMIYGEAVSDFFGETLITGVDFDNDGSDNTVVGASGNNYVPGSTYYGSVFVYDAFPTGSYDADTNDVARLYASITSSYTFPSEMWGLDDFDSDGKDELAVLYRGAYVYLYEGEDLSGTLSGLTSTVYYDYFSATGPVSSLGDEHTPSGNNETGIANSASSTYQGAITIYGYGTAGFSSLGTINGEDTYDYAGHGLAGYEGNDPNGDGYDDIFVGAYGDDDGGSAAGAAYVVEAPVTATFDLSGAQVKIVGSTAGDDFGYLVQAPGDVDGDGQPDLLATAPYDDDGGTDAGTLFIFEDVNTDGTTKDNDATDYEVKVIGHNAADYLGLYAPATGDVNGDGELDLLMGSPTWDSGATSTAGAAWLIYGPLAGSYDLASDYDARFLGNGTGDYCGNAVGLGDLDADGNADLVMGCRSGDKEGYVDYGTVYFFAGM